MFLGEGALLMLHFGRPIEDCVSQCGIENLLFDFKLFDHLHVLAVLCLHGQMRFAGIRGQVLVFGVLFLEVFRLGLEHSYFQVLLENEDLTFYFFSE